MKIKILTLFPNMFNGFLSESIIKRAIDNNLIEVEVIDYRKYSQEKHNHVDDTPYGGGAGMVIKCDVIDRAIEDNKTNKSFICLMTPQGEQFTQKMAIDLSN